LASNSAEKGVVRRDAGTTEEADNSEEDLSIDGRLSDDFTFN
jgi:hypothetical protein